MGFVSVSPHAQMFKLFHRVKGFAHVAIPSKFERIESSIASSAHIRGATITFISMFVMVYHLCDITDHVQMRLSIFSIVGFHHAMKKHQSFQFRIELVIE